MLGVYPRASRSRGSPASRAMPWVVATAASISSISASSVARGFAEQPRNAGQAPACGAQRPQDRAQRRRAGGPLAARLLELAQREPPRERLRTQPLQLLPQAVAQVRVRQPVLDPHERLRVGQLGDETLRAAREPRPVELADPVVHREVAVELRVLQAEAGRGGPRRSRPWWRARGRGRASRRAPSRAARRPGCTRPARSRDGPSARR